MIYYFNSSVIISISHTEQKLLTVFLFLDKTWDEHGQTSLRLKGSKKQSINLRRLQVRLMSSDLMTSFTDVRTNVIESCEKIQTKAASMMKKLYDFLLVLLGHVASSLTCRNLANREFSCSVYGLMASGICFSQHSVNGTRPRILGSR